MTPTSITGLLALQGDYQKHAQMLKRMGESFHEVRTTADFDRIDRLIIPGGESTVFCNLLDRLGLRESLSEFARTKPVWGICAGMVLLAEKVNDNSIESYRKIAIDVDRNGYGRQVYSTIVRSTFSANGLSHEIDMVFIRAPKVTRVGNGVTPLMYRGDDPVLLSQDNILVSSFHPELTDSTVLHNYFINAFVQ